MSEYFCPLCRKDSLVKNDSPALQDVAISSEAYLCPTCGESFASFWGTPYLGKFNLDDMLSVMEITSLLNQFKLDKTLRPVHLDNTSIEVSEGYQRIQSMVERATSASGGGVTLSDFGYESIPHWFESRFNELSQLRCVIGELDFTGKSMLDIGAGTGFDASRFRAMGARVTALEYSPIQAVVGAENFRDIEWIGGSATHIPFPDETFDFVVANASLHHMFNLEGALDEMLRVLRVGGHLLTMADSFAPLSFTESDEVKSFNNHLPVLGGVNEQIPLLSRFLVPLLEHKASLSAEVLTPVVHGFHERTDDLRHWTIDEALEKLMDYRGGICMKIEKHAATTHVEPAAVIELVPFDTYVPNLTTRPDALLSLVDYLPSWVVDRPLLNDEKMKFRLLTGWRQMPAKTNYVEIANAAYLIASPHYLTHTLSSLWIRRPAALATGEEMCLDINGELLLKIAVPEGKWCKVDLVSALDSLQLKERNLVRFALLNPASSIEGSLVQITNIDPKKASTANWMVGLADRIFSRVSR